MIKLGNYKWTSFSQLVVHLLAWDKSQPGFSWTKIAIFEQCMFVPLGRSIGDWWAKESYVLFEIWKFTNIYFWSFLSLLSMLLLSFPLLICCVLHLFLNKRKTIWKSDKSDKDIIIDWPTLSVAKWQILRCQVASSDCD